MRQFGSIRKLKSGRWQARYWDTAFGKQRSTPETFRTRGDASRWLASLESGSTSATAVIQSKSDTRLNEFAATWLTERPVKPRTAELYESQYRLHIAPHLGEIKMARLEPKHVRSWHHKLLNSHLKQPTVAKVYRLLRSILNTAVDDGLVSANPCRIKGAGVERSKERQIPTLNQFRHLAASVPDHLEAVVWIAGIAGLRKGEIFGLARSHIDLEGQQIKVERSLQEITGAGAVLGDPKTFRSTRDVTIPIMLVEILERHLNTFVEPDPDCLLFTNSYGRPIRRSVWGPVWDNAQAKTGLEDIRLHDLRHLSGTLVAIAGATLKETMNHLGHSTTRAALRYQHIADGRSQELADKLDDVLHPSDE